MSDTARELAERYAEQRGFEPRPSSSGADARDLVTLLFAKGEARVAFLAGWNACEQQRPNIPPNQNGCEHESLHATGWRRPPPPQSAPDSKGISSEQVAEHNEWHGVYIADCPLCELWAEGARWQKARND